MRSVANINSLFWLAGSLASLAIADPLATIFPCPHCPKGVAPPPITVTEMYQPVSTCEPSQSCTVVKNRKNVGHTTCAVVPSVVSVFDYVYTVIPCLDGASTVTVTKTEQIIPLRHYSTVETTVHPCPTQPPPPPPYHPAWNGTFHNHTVPAPPPPPPTCTPTTEYHTVITDISCPYYDLGPLGNAGYGGSGLCHSCSDDNGDKHQPATVTVCYDGTCTTQTQTWLSRKPTPTTSTSTAKMSTTHYCPSNGVYTVPISSAYTPAGNPGYTAPVTTTITYTTTVTNAPISITCESSVPIEFTAPPTQPATSSATGALSTQTYCPNNGPTTIPITTTYTPTGPESSKYTPVTTTVYYTTTITNAPTTVECTTTITITLTETTCPYETVVSGTTMSSHGPTTGPATNTVGPTTGGHTPTGPPPTSTPTCPPVVGSCDFAGCFGSKEVFFPSFQNGGSSGAMTIEMCIDECKALGSPFAGLYKTDCYCGSSIDYLVERPPFECRAQCPGNQLESCGGDDWQGHYLLDIYECPVPTTTSSSPSSTSTCPPEPSNGPDEEEHGRRNIDADTEVSLRHIAARDDNSKLRRGGMVRSHAKKSVAGGSNMQKRNLGLKKNSLLATA